MLYASSSILHDRRVRKVPFRVLRHFTHKTSVMSVNAEANAHSADWLMGIFVNELSPPHARSQQGQCVRQCRRIMKDTIRYCIYYSYMSKKKMQARSSWGSIEPETLLAFIAYLWMYSRQFSLRNTNIIECDSLDP